MYCIAEGIKEQMENVSVNIKFLPVMISKQFWC